MRSTEDERIKLHGAHEKGLGETEPFRKTSRKIL